MDELCECPGPKTRTMVQQNANTCQTCNKFMVHQSFYELPRLENEGENEEGQNQNGVGPELLNLLKNLSLGYTKPRGEGSVKLKAPSYAGKKEDGEVAHFFIKVKNYLEANKVSRPDAKIRVFKQC